MTDWIEQSLTSINIALNQLIFLMFIAMLI